MVANCNPVELHVNLNIVIKASLVIHEGNKK